MNSKATLHVDHWCFAALVSLLTVTNVAWAQQKFSINTTADGQTSKYIQQHRIDVGDVPGHQIRIQETQRIHNEKSTLEFSGAKVKEGWVRGYSDYTNGKGAAWGYGIWMLEDGNKVFYEYIGTSHAEPTVTGSLKGTYHGTTHIKGGTGKYKGIRGTTTDSVTFDNDPTNGYNRTESKGEYWFEQ